MILMIFNIDTIDGEQTKTNDWLLTNEDNLLTSNEKNFFKFSADGQKLALSNGTNDC